MKNILITGASTGIGAATAVTLAENNTVFVHYNSSQNKAQHVAEQVAKRGGNPLLVQADLSTEMGCRSLIDFVEKEADHLDLLVNSAGGMVARENVEEIRWTTMQKIFALNVYSAMMVTSLAINMLKKGTDPSIVFLTSVAQRHGAPTATVYGASKSALDSFTRGIAKELSPSIRGQCRCARRYYHAIP